MKRFSYLILFYISTAFLVGCDSNDRAAPEVLAADNNANDDIEEIDDNEPKPPKKPVEVVEIVEEPAPVVVIAGPDYPPLPPFLGGGFGGGGSGQPQSPRSELSIEKTASVASIVAGELITYTFTIVNTGTVVISGIDVAETAFSGLGLTSALSCNPAEPAVLNVGAQMVCTATYTVQQGDVDALSLSNSVQVTGTDPSNSPVSDTDSLILPAFIDFGDAPDTFGTLLASTGARHSVPGYDSLTNVAPLRLGATIDVESNGLPSVGADGDDLNNIDDENGVIATIQVIGGLATTVVVSATNNTASVATLAGWIDLNSSGTFEVGERQIIAVPANSGTANYNLIFPAAVVVNGSSYARFRLFPGNVLAPSATGPAAGGEVEDYVVTLIEGLDFSDAPDSFGTLFASNGARHSVADYNVLTNTAGLMLGSLIDIEFDGFPGVPATGDDLNNADDEDAIGEPIVVFDGSIPEISVSVTNNTLGVATLAGWIDYDQDGIFEVGELATAAIPASSGTASYTLAFPLAAVVEGSSYARFRVFPGVVVTPTPTGTATAGEVEDHTVQLRDILDFGDAPDSYGTLYSSDGARHVALNHNDILNTSTFMIGALIDIESDGVPGVAATGDDLDLPDDEEGVASPIVVLSGLSTSVSVVVTNNSATVGTLAGWIDLNNDGDFDVAELITAAIPALSGTAAYNLIFPASVVGNGSTYARFRLLPGVVAAPLPTGIAAAGEVEDYAVTTSVLIP